MKCKIINPNSFAEKVILNVIDKLIIGLIAAGIVLCVQSRSQVNENDRQRRISAAQLESRLVAETMTKTFNEINAYYRIALTAIENNQKIKNTENTKLVEHRTDVKISLTFLEAVVGSQLLINAKSKFENLFNSMSNLRTELNKDEVEYDQRKDKLDEFENSYQKVVLVLRDAALDAIRIESYASDE